MTARIPSAFALSVGLALLAALLVAPGAGAQDRVVAIGDIHGAFDPLVDILERSELIDERRDWSGGGARFVQTGDFTDRGSGVREVMELLMKLERQAEAGSGEVHLLLGNHEVMNILGDDRDMLENPDIVASFTDERSEERRQEAYRAWSVWRDRRRDTLERLAERFDVELSADLVRFLDQSREEWLAAHPPGLVEYREAFAPEGRYGAWVRRMPIAATVDDSLFVHAGISSDFAKLSVQQLNRVIWKRLKEWDSDRKKLVKRGIILPYFSWVETRMALELQLRVPESQSARILARAVWERLDGLLDDVGSENSPLWFRGYSEPPRGLEDAELGSLLDRTDRTHGVRRTIAAHTPLARHEIVSRLDGRLFLIDTGMLAPYYGGRASALEISSSGVRMIYADRPSAVRIEIVETAPPAPGPRPRLAARGVAEPTTPPGFGRRVFLGADGTPLPVQGLDQLESFLSTARVLSHTPLGQGTSGAQRLLLEGDGMRAHAIFHTIDVKRGGGPREPVVLGDGSRLDFYRDSYVSHAAVYRLARLMGMSSLPPTVIRKLDRETGSLTLWIERGTNLTRYRERGEGDPRPVYFARQIADQRVFDNLIANTDRNTGNIFWTGDFDLWFIDHTRSMARSTELYRPDRLSRCSRTMYERLEALDPKAVASALSPYLSSFEIKALMKRRDKVLAVLRSKMRKMGESKVLFEYGEPLSVRTVPDAA